MEHYPQSQPMDRRKWIGFDAFDAVMAEALDELPPALPDQPAQPDNVTDLNANVHDLFPPDEAA